MIEVIDIQAIHKSLLESKQLRQRAVEKYITIMDNFHKCDVSQNLEFQRIYKGFYRVRRNTEFCQLYFEYMEQHKNANIKLDDIITHIYKKTSRIEPSFSSKMLATINPNMPVWDKNVISQLSLDAPPYYRQNRLQAVIETYSVLGKWFANYLETQNAKDVIHIFNKVFPNIQVTNIKKIDLALWSLGAKE